MDLSELDGFLAGLVAGPEVVPGAGDVADTSGWGMTMAGAPELVTKTLDLTIADCRGVASA
jgi:hypothetical protein